jgi:cob(I)alamin adenosyltransferase
MKKSDDTSSVERKEALSIINTANPHHRLPRVATLASRTLSDRNFNLRSSTKTNISGRLSGSSGRSIDSPRSEASEIRVNPQFCSMIRGETISKASNLFAAIGSLHELVIAINLYKNKYLSFQNSNTLFQLAKCQETLINIRDILLDGKDKTDTSKINFYEGTSLKPNFLTSSLKESELLSIWAICQRTERQIAKLADGRKIVVSSWIGRYLNCLGRWFIYLSTCVQE